MAAIVVVSAAAAAMVVVAFVIAIVVAGPIMAPVQLDVSAGNPVRKVAEVPSE